MLYDEGYEKVWVGGVIVGERDAEQQVATLADEVVLV